MSPHFTRDLQPNRWSHMITTPLDTGYTTNKRAIMDGHSTPQVSQRLAAMVAMLTLCAGLVAVQQSYAAGVWTNEPAGASVLVDCNFSSSPGACGILDVYGSGISVSDSSAPVSPAGGVKALLRAYDSQGGMQLIYATPQPVREMYVGFTWRTNPQFQGRIVQNKLFFIRGNTLGNGYFGMWNPPGSPTMKMEWGHNTSGLDNSHTCALDLGLWCYANVGPSMITLGQWARVEVYQKASTTATSRDGILRWWINGVQGGNYTNLNYAPSGLTEWQWNNTWDGAQDMGTSNTVDWEHWIDHLHISVPNGGSGTDSPPGPPATPTLRSISVP